MKLRYGAKNIVINVLLHELLKWHGVKCQLFIAS